MTNTGSRRPAVSGSAAALSDSAEYNRYASSKNEQRKKSQAEKKKTGLRLIFLEFDKPFFLLVMVLLVLGTVMMFSASYAWSLADYGNGYVYVKKQIMIGGLGLLAMLAISAVDYHIFMNTKLVYLIFLGSLGMLAYTSFFGIIHGGARRWLKIGGIEFQPSEIMKFAIVILFSYIISVNYKKMKDFKYGIVPFMLVLGIVAALMMAQPHLSGTILICSIGIIMMFVGGSRFKHLMGVAAAGAVALTGFVIYLVAADKFSYFTGRIQSWLDPFSDMQDTTWQTCQSLIAIGSGGLFGMGFGESRQKFLYLSESKNDFVFAVVCEELGFIGAMLVIALFGLFIFRGFYIASRSPDKLGMMIAVGLTAQIGLQALLNIAVVTNSIPNTGISLPFFSYGGTALAMQLAQMGVILNISRQAVTEE